LRLSLPKISPFIVAADHTPRSIDSQHLAASLPQRRSQQLSLFA
jgi:hypothetical protein